MRHGEICPDKSFYVFRFSPFPVGLAGIHGILPVRPGDAQRFGIDAAPFSAAGDHEFRVAQHVIKVIFQNPSVAVFLPEAPGHQDADVRPAHRTVHNVHEPVFIGIWRDLRQFAVLPLPVKHVAQMLARKSGIIRQIAGRAKENLAVAGPAHSLPGRTVGGNIRRIGFQRPFGCFIELIHQCV